MKTYILIGIGGILGAISRYLIKDIHLYHYRENVPVNTLLINIAGSFLLALVLTAALELWDFDADVRHGITIGFSGAFTTFSTFCMETAGLMKEGFYFSAISYMTVSAMLGLAAVYFGTVLAKEAVCRLLEKDSDVSGEFAEDMNLFEEITEEEQGAG